MATRGRRSPGKVEAVDLPAWALCDAKSSVPPRRIRLCSAQLWIDAEHSAAKNFGAAADVLLVSGKSGAARREHARSAEAIVVEIVFGVGRSCDCADSARPRAFPARLR